MSQTPLTVSEISICNVALARIGEEPIASFDQESTRARKLKALWPLVRDAEIRDHNWNTCIKRVKLQRLDVTTIGFAFTYQLPSDYGFLLEIVDAPEQSPYKIEGNALLTDLTEVYIRYVFRNLDGQSYDPLFIDVLAWRVAKDIAISITGSKAIRDTMEREYTAALPKARTRDGQEDFPTSIPANDLIYVRY